MHFSSQRGGAQESALLESRILFPHRQQQCLQLFYRMTGSPQDRLVVWVRMDDGTGTVRKMKKIHTFNGIEYVCGPGGCVCVELVSVHLVNVCVSLV